MFEERNYQFLGNTPQWIPGVGVVAPGQTFRSRIPLNGNPLIVPSAKKATPTGELPEDAKVCKKCVRTKKADKSIRKKD